MANEQNLTPFTTKDKRASDAGTKGGTNKKGSKHINTWIQNLLQDEDFATKIRIGYEITDFKGAPIEAIIKAQMIKAIEGDTKAFDSLAKYGWAAKAELDLTSNGETVGQPIDENLLTQFLMNIQENTKR